jgi:hypothetical protein
MTAADLLLLCWLIWRRLIARLILDRRSARPQRCFDACDLRASLGDAIGGRRRRKDFTTVLRRLRDQVGQRATVLCQQGQLLIDGVIVQQA